MSKSTRQYFSNAGITLSAAVWMLFVGMPVLADDTEIYFGQPESDPENNPNILFIIDSSGSMDNIVYDDAPYYRDRLAVVQDVSTQLISELENVNIGMMKYDIAYTNRAGWQGNYDLLGQGGMVVHPISDLDDNRNTLTTRINNIHHFGSTPLAETYYEAGLYFLGETVDFGANSWHGYLNASNGYTYLTPLASHADAVSGGKYKSPFKGACQRNFIVYLSDGAPTYDDSAEARIESLMGDSSYTGHSDTICKNAENGSSSGRCIDEFAEFLYENDFSPTIPGKQNVVSHFIGFNVDLPIFKEAASRGGGNYYQANNAEQLKEDLSSILKEVAETNDGFTAPAVTVNAFDRTSHLDQLFFTVFKPTANKRWNGNIKKYKFEPRANEDGLVIVDANGDPAVDPATGFFYDGREQNGEPNPALPKAQSYWSVDENGAPVKDGAAVNVGGAASVLPNDPTQRKIYTNSGTTIEPLSTSASFQSALDAAHSASQQDPRLTSAQWRQWALGYDVNDENEDGDITDARKQIGAPLHSKPTVVVYGGTNDSPDAVIFVGTNDGLLHAISGETGEELWAFMPEELHGIVPELAENDTGNGDIPYGVDGHIVIEKKDDGDGTISTVNSDDRVYLYFGMRRGSNAYYKLDVTDYDSAPKIEWIFDDAEGQSWSRPVVANVNFGTDNSPNPKRVVLIGGGYDPAQESQGSYADDANVVGNSIHMIDAYTGNELWRASTSNDSPSAPKFLEVPEMKSSIPSAVRVLDMNLDGLIDRMYVNDLAGRLFRFDIHTDGSSQRITAGMIAELGGSYQTGATHNRRYYYAPDVALSSANGVQFLTITMGSGFRAHPLNETIRDRLSGVRDYNVFNKLGIDSSSDGSEYEYNVNFDTMSQIVGNNESQVIPDGAKGWWRDLGTNGQKALARSRIFQNKAYFTTYTPGEADSSNPCAPAVGSGKLYTIDLKTGLTEATQLEKPGIPPEITFIFGETEEGDTDDCFGADCYPGDPGDPTVDPIDPPGDGTDDEESTKPGEREVECLAGPESCDAEAAELPRRTFWRQTTVD